MPKVGSNYIFLVVISIYFVVKKHKKFYPQVFSKKCKYIEKDKKVITDDLQISSDDSYKENFDKED